MEIDSKNLKFFGIAREQSKKSTYYQKLGAVVVKKGKVLNFGYNQPKRTHPKSSNPYKTIHAELAAILKIREEDLNGAVIYVYREHKSGALACAKPCPYCSQMLKELGIKKVYYSDYTGYKEESYYA